MTVQHSPSAKNTISQRNKAALTSTATAPVDHTPSVHQMSENLDGGPSMEGEAPSRRGGAREPSGASNIAVFNQPLASQAEPNFPMIMEQMMQFMGKLTQEVSPRDNSRAPAFKTPPMKSPDPFDGD
ncbi:hypothetical protein O181_059684 [Austropuccinia psidii MF-1]|uniref:Uncharacterized protein n=1 Tax=Austropuccinia psidii MF-1 TaxID=1389203 RepID=A0A9Q3HYV8_9BASI|nr:hypothetical protein [Austropuccinia psidii MF-1]